MSNEGGPLMLLHKASGTSGYSRLLRTTSVANINVNPSIDGRTREIEFTSHSKM